MAKCPKCNGNLVLKQGCSAKNGRVYRFYGCQNYPNCKVAINSKGIVKDNSDDVFAKRQETEHKSIHASVSLDKAITYLTAVKPDVDVDRVLEVAGRFFDWLQRKTK